MGEEAVTTNTETSTETAPANDAVETTALGGAPASQEGTTEQGTEATETTEAKTETEAPVTPDKYELAAPEGMTLDADAVALAEPVFKELGLSNEQANKLMPVAGAFAQKIADGIAQQQLADVTSWRKETLDAAKADPEVGGAKWDESIATAAKALDTLGAPQEFRTWLNETGLGNHVEFVRMFSKVGRIVGEDSNFARGDAGAKTDVPIWDRVYATKSSS